MNKIVYNLNEAEFFRDYSFLTSKTNKKENTLSPNYSYIPRLLVLFFHLVEIIRNLIIISLRWNHPLRLVIGDNIVTQNNAQIVINFLYIICAGGGVYNVYYNFRDKINVKYCQYFDFMLKKNYEDYLKVHYVTTDFAENIYNKLAKNRKIRKIYLILYLSFVYKFSFASFFIYKEKGVLEKNFAFIAPFIIVNAISLSFYYFELVETNLLFRTMSDYLCSILKRLSNDLDIKHKNNGVLNKVELKNHLYQLNLLLKKYKNFQYFFERKYYASLIPVLCKVLTYPFVTLEGDVEFFLQPLVVHYLINLFLILIPFVRYNETIIKSFNNYWSSIYSFVLRNRKTPSVNKLISVINIYQKDGDLTFNLFHFFKFNTEFLLLYLIETVSFTFLLYTSFHI